MKVNPGANNPLNKVNQQKKPVKLDASISVSADIYEEGTFNTKVHEVNYFDAVAYVTNNTDKDLKNVIIRYSIKTNEEGTLESDQIVISKLPPKKTKVITLTAGEYLHNVYRAGLFGGHYDVGAKPFYLLVDVLYQGKKVAEVHRTGYGRKVYDRINDIPDYYYGG